MTHHSIDVHAHKELTAADPGERRRLFGSEYLEEFGEWDPGRPYGCASCAWRIVRNASGTHEVPSMLMGVTDLGYDGQLVEIEAVAAVVDQQC